MRPVISKKQSSDLSNRPEAAEKKNGVGEEEEEEDDDGGDDSTVSVTTHLYLKPPHGADRLDREVVLRRIRHRKRVSKLRSSAAQALFNHKPPAPKSTTADHSNKSKSIPLMIKWADDAFAAL